ncbi:MAG: hypothetical protein ACR2NJ_04670, partial [Acidimicrobiales bacterium]
PAGLVAVGSGMGSARMWTSLDGLAWQEVPLPGAAATARWRPDLVATDGATTVVADDTAGAPRLVTNNGGWTEVTASPAAFGAPRSIALPTAEVGYAGGLLLAVDVEQPGQALGTATTSAMVLSSADGRVWKASGGAGQWAGAVIRGLWAPLVATSAGSATAVGEAGDAGSTARAWTSTDTVSWHPSELVAAAAGSGPSAAVVLPLGSRAEAVARLGNQAVAAGEAVPVSGSNAGNTVAEAVAWTTTDYGSWTPANPLDQVVPAGFEAARGVCAGTTSMVAVGVGDQAGPGTSALTWTSSDGTHWRPARVSPPPAPGSLEAMNGCVSSGAGFVAFGADVAADGSTGPALWRSGDGLQWTREGAGAFSGPQAGPITGLAVHGSDWLAVSGFPDPAAVGRAEERTGQAVAVWQSGDAGISWRRVNTTGAPWLGHVQASSTTVGFVGSTPVVAGSVDGQLAVWVGASYTIPGSSS